MIVDMKKINDRAIIPMKAHEGDAAVGSVTMEKLLNQHADIDKEHIIHISVGNSLATLYFSADPNPGCVDTALNSLLSVFERRCRENGTETLKMP